MYRPGTDEANVQMSDVLCDFCARAWTEDVPFIEGHRGATICGSCLSVAYAEAVYASHPALKGDFLCVLCREGGKDRAALHRESEAGWESPVRPGACVCRRCCRRSAAVLEKDPDFNWRRPASAAHQAAADEDA